MMKQNVKALALCLLMPALMMADDAPASSNVCLSQQTTRGGAHFLSGVLTGAGQGYWSGVVRANSKDVDASLSQDKQDAQADKLFKITLASDILSSIAGGHVNNIVGVNLVNTVLLQKNGDEAQRTDADKVASALGQQAGHALVTRRLGWAMNPFDALMVFSWLKTQAQAAQNYASDEVAQYESTDDSKMMKRK
jgi:hypothetical protein